MCFSRETTGITLSSSQTHIKYFSFFSFISPLRYSSGELCSKWQHLWQPVLFVLPFVLPVKSRVMKIAVEPCYYPYLCEKKKEEVTVYFPEGQTEPLTATSIEGLCISEAAWGRMYPCLYVSKRSSTVLNRIPHSCVNKIPYNKLISLPRTMKMPLAEFSECAFSPLCQQMPFRCSERDRFWKCRRCLLTLKLLIYWIGTLLFHFNNS